MVLKLILGIFGIIVIIGIGSFLYSIYTAPTVPPDDLDF